MIPNFLNIVQQDFIHIRDGVNNGIEDSDEGKRRIGRAALRTFAVLGMAFSALFTLGAIRASTTGGAIASLIIAIASYVVSHDVFVIVTNSEKNIVGQVFAVGKSILGDIGDLLNGKKTLKDAPSHPFNEGTFLRPMWDIVLSNGAIAD